jgi:transposase
LAQGLHLRDHHRGPGATGGARSLPGTRGRHDSDWLKRHPGVEIISRDRCGSFAQGAHEGAPQARQIADRFHILQNLREAVQAQLGRAAGFSARPLLPADGEEVASVRDKHGGAEHRHITRVANERSRQAVFERVRALHKEGRNVMDIARQTGFDRRTVAKWIRAEVLPQRSASAPKTTSPWHFEDYLSRRWSEGCVRGRRLFQETASGEMAQSETQNHKDRTDCSKAASTGSSDRTFDLADRRRRALHQAA